MKKVIYLSDMNVVITYKEAVLLAELANCDLEGSHTHSVVHHCNIEKLGLEYAKELLTNAIPDLSVFNIGRPQQTAKALLKKLEQ